MNWMLKPQTIEGGFGRLFIGLIILNIPISMFKSLTSGYSGKIARQPAIEQVQASPSPVASPIPSPSPATSYEMTLQVNTTDGDRVPQPGGLEVEGGIYKASVPFEGLNASDERVRQVMVYEFNFVAKTVRQYCEDCLMPLKRPDASEEALIVDSVVPEGFSVTPKEMADEIGIKDFYILRLTGSVKPDTWLQLTEQVQATEKPIAPTAQELREPNSIDEPESTAPPVRTSGNCSSFSSQAEAQASLEAGNSKLDRDKDGIACESLL
jgi:Excalibur calcium-binding domain